MMLDHLCCQDRSSQELTDSVSLSQINPINRITFPTAEQARCRRVVTRSRARPTGKYPSWKMGRMIQWESLNELHAFRLLDCDPQVTAFHEQPCEIVFVQNGEVRRHYPDVCVETRDSKELWEIKPESEAARAEIVARTTLLSNALRQYGFTYRLVLAHDLARQPRLHNANILLRHGRRAPTECEREGIRLLLMHTGYLNWGEVCHGVYGAKGLEVLCRLVLEGKAFFDMDVPLSPCTQFFSSHGDL